MHRGIALSLLLLSGCHLLLPFHGAGVDGTGDRASPAPDRALTTEPASAADRAVTTEPPSQGDRLATPSDRRAVDAWRGDLGAWCTCPVADVTGDGVVDASDLAFVSACFGHPVSAGCVAADITQDGVVDIRDLACVAKLQGACP